MEQRSVAEIADREGARAIHVHEEAKADRAVSGRDDEGGGYVRRAIAGAVKIRFVIACAYTPTFVQ